MVVSEIGTSARLTLTVEEAARVLGIARNTAYVAVKAGQIPCVRIGRRRLVPRRALEMQLGAGQAIMLPDSRHQRARSSK